ncbi:MAG: thioredoxin family protein [Rhodocyclaceae bacterium]|nr:thioredoxin family protein [Rhodocyclaceae bacterium]
MIGARPTARPANRESRRLTLPSDLSVTCLCADWCGTCRDYVAAFEGLGARYADTPFTWYDVEDDADVVGDLDIETFPTLLIRRAGHVVYLGPVLPDPAHAQRLIETYAEMPADEAVRYATATEERRAWQDLCDFEDAR